MVLKALLNRHSPSGADNPYPAGFPIKTRDHETVFGFTYQRRADYWLIFHPTKATVTRADPAFGRQLREVATGETTHETQSEAIQADIDQLEASGYLADGPVTELGVPPDISLRTLGLGLALLTLAAGAILAQTLNAVATTTAPVSAHAVALCLFAATTLFHEYGHVTACEPYFSPEIGLTRLNKVFPAAITRTNYAWGFPRNRRLWVNTAGPAVDLGSVILFGTGALLTGSSILGITAALAGLRTVLSLNPLLMSDGYWVLVDLFNKPNLRRRGKQHVTEWTVSWEAGYYVLSTGFVLTATVFVAYRAAQWGQQFL